MDDIGDNDRLKSYIDRVEKLEEEKSALAADIRDLYAEAKSRGFDPKIMRKVVSMRKKSEAERQMEQATLEVYMKELGMLADTPLGKAAMEREFKK